MCQENNEFENIRPYSDEEASLALSKVAEHPFVAQVSKIMFPDKDKDYLKNILSNIKTVNEFQELVMANFVRWVLKNTAKQFTYDGEEYLKNLNSRYLAISNHRDIILDPAITQIVLNENGLDLTEIAVGDNLLTNQYVEYLIRSNRMIKVIRGINARSLYLSSQLLSKYIRQSIISGKSSIWIAQKEGRAKDGLDKTEQGILKMFDMSGSKSFEENFAELHIVPLSISYEYEPCDIRKARETLISRYSTYKKSETEDLESIMMGIQQQKGNIHLSIAKPITREELAKADEKNRNEKYQMLRANIDQRIIEAYKLWPNNYIAYDLLHKQDKYKAMYTEEQMNKFLSYTEKQLSSVELELNKEELRDIFYGIYANPIVAKENIGIM